MLIEQTRFTDPHSCSDFILQDLHAGLFVHLYIIVIYLLFLYACLWEKHIKMNCWQLEKSGTKS